MSGPSEGAPASVRNGIRKRGEGRPHVVIDGRYRWIRRLGRGASGGVHLVVDLEDSREVALKWISRPTDAEARRLRKVAQAQRDLTHANIVGILREPFKFDWDGGQDLGLILDYIEGQPLDVFLRDWPHGRLELRDALPLAIQVADALAAAHSHEPRIVHRDLKPSNIILDLTGAAHLTDFGHAQIRRTEGTSAPLTAAHAHIGTIGFAAPELMEDAASAQPAADVYGIGAFLYRVVTGKLPRQSLAALLDRKPITPVAHLLSDAPAELDELLLTFMADDPEIRPSSGGEAVAKLRELV